MELLLDFMLKRGIDTFFSAILDVPITEWGPVEWGTVTATSVFLAGITFALLRAILKTKKPKRRTR